MFKTRAKLHLIKYKLTLRKFKKGILKVFPIKIIDNIEIIDGVERKLDDKTLNIYRKHIHNQYNMFYVKKIEDFHSDDELDELPLCYVGERSGDDVFDPYNERNYYAIFKYGSDTKIRIKFYTQEIKTYSTTGGPVCNAFDLNYGMAWLALFNNLISNEGLYDPTQVASQILVNGDFWSRESFDKPTY